MCSGIGDCQWPDLRVFVMVVAVGLDKDLGGKGAGHIDPFPPPFPPTRPDFKGRGSGHVSQSLNPLFLGP